MPAAANRFRSHDSLKVVRPGGRPERAEFISYARGRKGFIRVFSYKTCRVETIRREWAQKHKWKPRPKQLQLI